MKQKITLLMMLFFSLSIYSQQVGKLRGSVIDSETKKPISGVSVFLKNQNQLCVTNAKGEFIFDKLRIGDDFLILKSLSIIEMQTPVAVLKSNQNLGVFEVKSTSAPVDRSKDEVASLNSDAFASTLDDLDFDSEVDMSSQGISSLVLISDDTYKSKASYQFSKVRFRMRGYAQRYEKTYLNGIEFNDQNRGVFNYSTIGALNDMTRNGDVLNYAQPGTFTYGSIAGAQNIDLRAGSYGKGGTIRSSVGNGTYYARAMVSYNTGLMDNGWAFSGSVGGRYADEGYVKGSFYQNASYFFAAEKQWDGGRHSLALTTFGSPVQRAMGSASVKEAYDLTGDYFYNPQWGYQDGKKRSVGIVTAYDPTAILAHTFNINKTSKLTTGFGLHYSTYGKTALNWFNNSADPRPDYYRYLPSYKTDFIAPGLPPSELSEKEKYTQYWKNKDRSIVQIDWDKLYESNRGRDTALYIVEQRNNNLFEMTLNSTFDTRLNENLLFTGGIGLRSSKAMSNTTVDDMMGSSFILNRDKFGVETQPGAPSLENDLTNPNRKVYEGDRFGYDYDINIRSANLWVQNTYQFNAVDFYYGFKLAQTAFYRDGKMQNGRFPDNSLGKGKTHTFTDMGLKGGVTYKIDGRNFLVGNISYGTQAPLPNDAYIAPRVRDAEVPNLQSERVFATDLGYIFSFPTLRGRVTAFRTNFYDQLQKTSYYNDIDATFIHHAMSNVNKVHQGVELALEWKTTENLSLSFAGTLSDYYYSNRPDGSVYYENGQQKDEDVISEKVYIKDFYVGSTPQYAATFGVNYFYDYWFFGANLNGFARSYLDPTPIRRIASAFKEFPTEIFYEQVDEFTKQSKLKGGMTVDLSIGKLLFLNNGRSINFNASVNNLLNYEKMQTGGFEQGRIDKATYRLDKFPNKYYYMQGINFMLNVAYKF